MMHLNRNSRLVRYWLWVTFNRSEEERAEPLAKGTNVCGFVRELVLYSLLQLMLGVMLAVLIPVGVLLTWTIIAVAVPTALIAGYTPHGFDPRFQQFTFWWATPIISAAELQWRRNAGLPIGTRTLYAYHALIPLALVGLCWFEVAGWTRWVHTEEYRSPWIITHGVVGSAVAITVIAFFSAWLRKTDTWRVFMAWLHAKKDRVCPRIEFV